MARPSFRIAYVSTHDPHDVRAFSGIAHFACEALRESGNAVTVLRPPAVHPALVARACRLTRYALRTWHALRPERFDLVLVMQAAVLGALVPRQVPLVYASDITWRVYEGYYPPVYRRPWQLRLRRALERRAVQRADLLVYSSTWASESAVRDYDVPPERVAVIPYGANLPHPPPPLDPRTRTRAAALQLLFLGVSWERKGGAWALEAVRALNRRGIPARLTLCGCAPPAGTPVPDFVRLVPFLDKRVPADAARLDALLREAHFLLLPTRADATPVAFCEANAYGLPVVTTRTGGIPSVIEDGVNGRMLPLEAGAEDYAEVLARDWEDREAYARFSHRSRQRFEQRLNWSAWAESLHGALAQRFAAQRN
ncbi:MULTISPECIES: glycosyltransferase family 4 protein [Myxococcaceae]|uniref:glycosyltransferase family 4 protein n=1 Tax=Myxococcaceae TaxID=31 RepID=UPI00188EE9C9|nr:MULTISPECIES: glycosyltransferase family 4 protein [Myxococcaceae]MBF5044340.1 glycosyltransferase family 4 protein [Simulacricoccus sp. 17bor-14]